MKTPKVLLFDIETSPLLCYTWGTYNISNVIKVKKDWELLSFSWKWLDEKQTHCVSRRTMSEKSLVKKLWKLFKKSDIIVAHNGDEFDIKKSRAKFSQFNLPSPKIISTVDTKKEASRNFKFTSNSLNELGKLFGLGQKAQTGGFDLWEACMAGDKAAYKRMESYNIQDVILLEKIYNRLLPYMDKHPSIALLGGYKGCPNCGSENIIQKGYRATRAQIKRQLKCKSCDSWFLGPIKKVLDK